MHQMLLFLVVGGISCTPHNLAKTPANSEHSPLVHEDANIASLTALKRRSKKWHLEPLSVTKISKKSQDEGNTHSLSEVKESHSVFSNVNGNRQGFRQENQQVAKNGNLLSKMFHQKKQEAQEGGKPHIEEMTEIDVPEQNIHEKIVNNDGIERVVQLKRNEDNSSPNLHTVEELAGYVLETGDEASVVGFLENLLKDGKISEDEALVFVENIKSYIEEVQKASEQTNNEYKKIQEMILERKLEEENEELRLEEEEAAKIAYLQSMFQDVHKKKDENESILQMNTFLEEALKKGEISGSLYNHLKEALVESAIDGLKEDSKFPTYGPE